MDLSLTGSRLDLVICHKHCLEHAMAVFALYGLTS